MFLIKKCSFTEKLAFESWKCDEQNETGEIKAAIRFLDFLIDSRRLLNMECSIKYRIEILT